MCADQGAVCNMSTEDETGWDFVVEFPARLPLGLPSDMRPGDVACLVQVKSTTLGRPATRLKLSNALRFANAPLPCFVVLFVYARNGDGRGIYVSDFWREQMARTLEAARRAAAEGDERLHRRYLPMAFGAGYRAEDPVSRIAAEAAAHAAYAETKAAFLLRTGFEDGLGDASVTFGRMVTRERVVDAQLGLGDPLEVARFSFTTRRFGILAGPALADFGPGTLHIEARPTGRCVVSLAPETGDDEIDIAADVYLPSQPDLPDGLLKVRLRSPIFDLSVKPSTGETSFRVAVPPERALPLPDLSKLMRLRGMLANGPVACQARKDDVPFLSGVIALAGFEEHPAWADVRDFLAHVVDRVSPERLPPSITVSLNDLRDRGPAIMEFMSAIGAPALQVSAEDPVIDLAVEGTYAVFHAARVDFERFTVCTLVRRTGRLASRHRSSVALELGRGTCLRTLVLTSPSPSRSGTIEGELLRLSEVASRGGSAPVLVLAGGGRRSREPEDMVMAPTDPAPGGDGPLDGRRPVPGGIGRTRSRHAGGTRRRPHRISGGGPAARGPARASRALRRRVAARRDRLGRRTRSIRSRPRREGVDAFRPRPSVEGRHDAPPRRSARWPRGREHRAAAGGADIPGSATPRRGRRRRSEPGPLATDRMSAGPRPRPMWFRTRLTTRAGCPPAWNSARMRHPGLAACPSPRSSLPGTSPTPRRGLCRTCTGRTDARA